MRFHHSALINADGERVLTQVAVFCTKILADHAINHERAIHFAWRREDFPARQITPFVDADYAAGLYPLVVLVERRGDVCAGRGLRANGVSGAGYLPDFLAQLVNLDEIG